MHLASYAGWGRAMSAITIAEQVFERSRNRAARSTRPHYPATTPTSAQAARAAGAHYHDDKTKGQMIMTTWTRDELTRIGQAEELRIASTRSDGSPRPYVTIWVVRAGDDLYVRSAYGSSNPWFVLAKASGTGRIRAGGIERGVTFADADPDAHAAIDAAYHAKYDRYGPAIVGSVVGKQVEAVTIRLLPDS